MKTQNDRPSNQKTTSQQTERKPTDQERGKQQAGQESRPGAPTKLPGTGDSNQGAGSKSGTQRSGNDKKS